MASMFVEKILDVRKQRAQDDIDRFSIRNVALKNEIDELRIY